MLQNKRTKYLLPYALTLSMFSQVALGAGLEKNVLWSGRNAGVGGAVVGSIAGPEALYFNPAGLGGTTGLNASFNFSPTMSKFSGPIGGTNYSSKTNFSPPGALLVSYGVTPQFGLGVGFYAAGGSKVTYEGVNLGTNMTSVTVQSDISLSELSVGGGYELMEGLRVGFGYRVLMAKANLSFPFTATGQLVGSPIGLNTYSDATDTRWNGFRAGLQYAPRDSRWGVGAQWRSQVDLLARGSSSRISVLSATPTTNANATLGVTFPQQVSLGGFYDVFPASWRLLLQYDFTEYHKVKHFTATGVPATLNWKNQHNLRVGTEYKFMENLMGRFGYVYTSQVTPASIPLPTFAPPGPAHSFYLGAGTSLLPNLSVDGALEFTTSSGSSTAAQSSAANAGNYSAKAYAAHVGLTYNFGAI